MSTIFAPIVAAALVGGSVFIAMQVPGPAPYVPAPTPGVERVFPRDMRSKEEYAQAIANLPPVANPAREKFMHVCISRAFDSGTGLSAATDACRESARRAGLGDR